MSGVAIFDLDFDAILAAMYAVSISAEGDCYVCVPPDPGIEAAALGASESAAPGTRESATLGAGESALSGTASAQVFHTFTLDSGASRSFFRDRTTLTPLSRPVAVSLADPSGGPVLARYSTVLPCPAAPSGSLSGLYLPSFSTNLVSGADLQDAGVDQFTPASQRVTHCTCAQTGRHLATFTRRPGSSLYTLTTESPPVAASGQVAASSQVFAAASRSGPESAPCSCRLLSHQTLLWHHRLGHPSLPRLRGMASHVLVSGLPRSLPPLPLGPAPTCVPCVEGRPRAAPHSSEFPLTEAPLQTLHMDVWGPARVRGQGHERYFLLVVDNYSRYTTVFPLRSKGERWRVFLRPSASLLSCGGHRQTFSLPASPQQNGIAERRIGMVMDVARTSMIHAVAPHFLWPFAVQYAAHQINLQPRVSLPETSPTLRWTGKVGDASAFRVWGSRAFVRDLSADKLSSRAVPCVFVGFPPDAPGWPFYHPTSRRVLSSQDITFDELVPYYRLFPYRTAPLPPPPLFLAPGPPPVDPLPPQCPAPSGLDERREPESRPVSPVRTVRTSRRVPRQRPPVVPGTHQMALRPSTAPQRVPLPSPPESSLPALADPESDSLHAASPTVTRVLATVVTDPSFKSTTASALVAELVDFAPHCRLDYAASLVAESASVCPPSVGGECALSTDVLEDRQEEFQCFAAALPHLVSTLLAPEGDPDAPDIPTPRSYAEAIEGPYSSQWQAAMDAEMASWKSTGTYVDEVPPPGANIVSGMWIFRVKRPPGSSSVFKARYVARGFSQRQRVDYFQTFSPTPKMTTLRVLLHVAAQRNYELHSLDFSIAFLQGSLHEEIWLRRPPGFTGTTLVALGFTPSTADPSLFLRTDTLMPPFYILVNVDDLVFATADTAGLAHVKSELQKRHTCTDLGELHSYLGLQITWDRARRTITLTQSHMVQQVLQHFNFTYSSPQATPLSTRHSLSALPSDESVEPSGPYPELVGCLMYLMTCTRPDLAYPLSILARYVAPRRHRPEHMAAAKRVLRYLCSTSGLGLVLGGRSPVVLTGHADASWVDDLATQRSSQGYTFSLGSGSVSWRSTRSSSVLSSSCEAEIYAGAMAAQELRRLTYLLTDLGEPPRSPPVLMKHIALRYFLARELQQRGQLCLAYVASQANTADIFTKALHPCDHQRFCTMLACFALLCLTGLVTPSSPPLCLWGASPFLGPPTLRWTGEVGDASVFRVWGSCAFVRDTSAGKLSARALSYVFFGFVPDAPGWQFYHPTSRRVLPNQDVTFDESVPFYRLFPYRSAPPPPPSLFLAPGPPPVDPLPPQGHAPSGVSQVDPLPGSAPVKVAVGSGAARGAASGGAEPGGAGSEGAGSGGAEPGGEEPGGVEPGGAEPEGVESGGAESEGANSGGAEPRAGGAGAGGAGVTAGAGGTGGTAAAGPGGARTRGAGAAGPGGVGGAGAGDPTEPGAAGAGGSSAGGAGAGGAGLGGTGAGGARAVGAGAADPGAGGAGGTVRLRPYFVPLLQQVLGVPSVRIVNE
ncbi:unnamed protein product [Closterium sp. NIES-53]